MCIIVLLLVLVFSSICVVTLSREEIRRCHSDVKTFSQRLILFILSSFIDVYERKTIY